MKTTPWLLAVALALVASSARADFVVNYIRVDSSTGTGGIDDINEAETILAGTSGHTVLFTGNGFATTINYNQNFLEGPGDFNQFAVSAFANLTFNTDGNYVFRVNSDDGFRLRENGVMVSQFIGPRGAGDTDSSPITYTAGDQRAFDLTYFEAAGGDSLTFSYSLNGGAFQLVGSTGDITAVPEPSTWAMLGLGAIVAGWRIRKRRQKTAEVVAA